MISTAVFILMRKVRERPDIEVLITLAAAEARSFPLRFQ